MFSFLDDAIRTNTSIAQSIRFLSEYKLPRKSLCFTQTMKQATYERARFTDILSVMRIHFKGSSNITHYALTAVYVVSPFKDVAARVLDIIQETLGESRDVQLCWWEDASPRYGSDASSSSLGGQWLGYEPRQGFYEISQTRDQPKHCIILLHYTDGVDPASHADTLFDGGCELAARDSMIIAFSECLLDYGSCKNITFSKCSPVARAQTKRFHYYAPLPLQKLREVPSLTLLCEGKGRMIPRYHNWAQRYFPTRRRMVTISRARL